MGRLGVVPHLPRPAQDTGPLHTDPVQREVFATLVTHYWAHDGFLRGDLEILPQASKLAGLPGVLIHGRRDVSGPVVTAWRLHQRWSTSRFVVVEEDGHGGHRSMELVREAIDTLGAP